MAIASKKNVIDPLMGFCGLYCGDCLQHKGEVADLARDLRKKLREERMDEFAPVMSGFMKELKEYDKCYNTLGGLVKLRCKRGCREGRGPKMCAVGVCCVKKEMDGCWQCGGFEECKKLDFLRAVHKDAIAKNLNIIKKKGVDNFINGKRYW